MLGRGRGKIVNNASISGYAYFPAASTYAPPKAGVVAFSESLRRELKGTGSNVLQLVTPGTKMMDAMLVGLRPPHGHQSAWDLQPAEEWAAKVVKAIRSDDARARPGRPSGARQAGLARAGGAARRHRRPVVQPAAAEMHGGP